MCIVLLINVDEELLPVEFPKIDPIKSRKNTFTKILKKEN